MLRIVDLTGLVFIDASGLGAVAKRSNAPGGTVIRFPFDRASVGVEKFANGPELSSQPVSGERGVELRLIRLASDGTSMTLV
jgi:hypothetical protein